MLLSLCIKKDFNLRSCQAGTKLVLKNLKVKFYLFLEFPQVLSGFPRSLGKLLINYILESLSCFFYPTSPELIIRTSRSRSNGDCSVGIEVISGFLVRLRAPTPKDQWFGTDEYDNFIISPHPSNKPRCICLQHFLSWQFQFAMWKMELFLYVLQSGCAQNSKTVLDPVITGCLVWQMQLLKFNKFSAKGKYLSSNFLKKIKK